jgi:unsaturated chondroitin disaccharide hydrolase
MSKAGCRLKALRHGMLPSTRVVQTTPDPIKPGPEVTLSSLIARTIALADAKLKRTAGSLDPRNGFPRYGNAAAGTWVLASAKSWTSGFFAGSLWLMYAITRDGSWRTMAERWTLPLEINKLRTNTHDLGFIVFNSFGLGHRLTGNAHFRDVVLDASRSLVRRFNTVVGAIKAWDTDSVADGRRGWPYTVIVDSLMNLEMLFWAARHGGDAQWARIAEHHALTSAQVHLREDGSTAHAAWFDPLTGALLKQVTWQGHADSSVWARGQAWAIYGLIRAYEDCGRTELLFAARKAADWFIAHLPPDGVPYWDFRDPSIPSAPRDASAAAIAACGLYRLARACESGNGFRGVADAVLASLCTDYVSSDPRTVSLTEHSVGAKPQGLEVDVGLIYTDYYLLDAIATHIAVSFGLVEDLAK